MRPTAQMPLTASLSALVLGLLMSVAVSTAHAQNLPDVQRMMKQNQMPQALEAVDAYISSKPKDAQGRFLRGLILTEMGRTVDAIAVFTKLTEDFPELPEPYNNLAVLYAQQKQYDKARTALEMAIRTHPSYSIAHENLGDVYAKLASQAYDKALQLDSSNATTQTKLSLIKDLISTSSKPGSKPGASATPAAPETAKSVAAAKVPEAKPIKPVEKAPEPAARELPPLAVVLAPSAISEALRAWAFAPVAVASTPVAEESASVELVWKYLMPPPLLRVLIAVVLLAILVVLVVTC